jgi:hypothetical protein
MNFSSPTGGLGRTLTQLFVADSFSDALLYLPYSLLNLARNLILNSLFFSLSPQMRLSFVREI